MTKNNITTIEGLAALINETMASKEDIKEFRAEVNQKFELVESRLDRIGLAAANAGKFTVTTLAENYSFWPGRMTHV
jgi:hypothetical protein